MNTYGPLDAIISGYGYEMATTALGVLEEGQSTKRWMSTAMLCCLDNFIKVVLFNDRIFITGCADLTRDSSFTVREVKCGVSNSGRQLLHDSGFFPPLPAFNGDKNAVDARVNEILGSLDMSEHPLFVIECEFLESGITLLQETVYLDPYLIEYAIERFGVARFKPVFPGEHLYLGLRRQQIPVPQATHTMADLPARRLRTVIRAKMEKLNTFVPQGAPMLPALPPMFVARLLHDSPRGADLVPRLLEIRNSPAMRRFREWMLQTWKLSQSEQIADREKASAAYDKLQNFSPDDDILKTEFGISLIKIAKKAVTGDVVGIATEVAQPVIEYLGGIPIAGLRQFGSAKTDSTQIDKFLTANFGDKFNRHEMDHIAIMLCLPEDLTEWSKANATLRIQPGRLDNAPPLSRPYRIQIKDQAYVDNAKKDFEDLWRRGKPLAP